MIYLPDIKIRLSLAGHHLSFAGCNAQCIDDILDGLVWMAKENSWGLCQQWPEHSRHQRGHWIFFTLQMPLGTVSGKWLPRGQPLLACLMRSEQASERNLCAAWMTDDSTSGQNDECGFDHSRSESPGRCVRPPPLRRECEGLRPTCFVARIGLTGAVSIVADIAADDIRLPLLRRHTPIVCCCCCLLFNTTIFSFVC